MNSVLSIDPHEPISYTFFKAVYPGFTERDLLDATDKSVYKSGLCLKRSRKITNSCNDFRILRDFGLIAGSCATKNHEPRQVREEATVVSPFV